jgi:hypothetical protein
LFWLFSSALLCLRLHLHAWVRCTFYTSSKLKKAPKEPLSACSTAADSCYYYFFLPVDYPDAIAAACFPFFLFEKYRVSVEDSAAIVALRGHFGFTHSPFFSAFLQFVFSAHLLCSATRLHESDEVFFCSDFYLPAAQATETCEEQTFEIASTRNITSHRVAFSSEHTQYWVAARHRGGFSTTLERHLFTWGRSLPLPSFPFFHRCS